MLEGIKTIFKTTQPVIIYTATGTGAWEAALTNTLSPGDRVLMVETGQFATLWKVMAERLGLKPEFIKTDWRVGADPKVIEEHLRKDKAHEIKAVCVLHNETATGCLSPIAEIRKAIDAAGHPALFLVDTISSLASTDYRHDEWGVDVTIGGAQKGLMLPPGMSFNAVSEKALRASKTAKLPRSFFSWDDMLTMYKQGFFPYTPATQMLYGLDTSIQMLHEEGLDNVFARHRPARRSDAPRGARLGARNPLPRSEILFADASPPCCCRTATMPISSASVALNTFNISLRRQLRSLCEKVLPHRPSRRHQRRHADRRAGGDEMALSSPACRTRRAACRRRWTTSCRLNRAASRAAAE